ncbi:hypothetical protein E2C01_087544 [Portunus trituberculatus]|uniref:Uncharacterized protein n=1 Tax=Portunus trituberculatus TaxID=210409 RepID=A0A5B7JCS1_PORTR|nr:hypothetical protein [Portunus trituberculatus]
MSVCEEYGVAKQTVSDIINKKNKLVEYSAKFCKDASSGKRGEGASRKNVRSGKDAALDISKLLIELSASPLHNTAETGERDRLREPGVLSDLPESLDYEIFTSPLNIFLLGVCAVPMSSSYFCFFHSNI